MYNGQDLILTLPKSVSVFDINYVAIFNVDIQKSLGHIEFNVSNARIPPALGQTKKPGWWFNTPIQPPKKPDRPANGAAAER